jgi:hypothetical protein
MQFRVPTIRTVMPANNPKPPAVADSATALFVPLALPQLCPTFRTDVG